MVHGCSEPLHLRLAIGRNHLVLGGFHGGHAGVAVLLRAMPRLLLSGGHLGLVASLVHIRQVRVASATTTSSWLRPVCLMPTTPCPGPEAENRTSVTSGCGARSTPDRVPPRRWEANALPIACPLLPDQEPRGAIVPAAPTAHPFPVHARSPSRCVHGHSKKPT